MAQKKQMTEAELTEAAQEAVKQLTVMGASGVVTSYDEEQNCYVTKVSRVNESCRATGATPEAAVIAAVDAFKIKLASE